MRKIAEVAEDIKSILNNIERTQECNGETLVDINELVDEIISIDSIENTHAKKLFDRVYRNDCFMPDEIAWFEKIENALGFKLYFWQKTFLITGHFRQTGETTARCLKRLLGHTPIDCTTRPTAKEYCERLQLMKIKELLEHAGVETVPIFTSEKDLRTYKKRMQLLQKQNGTFPTITIIDEIHTKPQEGE